MSARKSDNLSYASTTARTVTRGGKDFGKSLVNWLFPAYVLLMGAGYGVFISGIANVGGMHLAPDRCLFQAVNAATLTGFPCAIGVHEFNLIGQITCLLLMSGGILFSFIVGGLAVVRILRLPYSDRYVIGFSVLALLVAAGLGTAGGLLSGRSAFESLFLGVSAFGNGGLIVGETPANNSALLHLLLLPLATLGGLGVTVLMECFSRLRGKVLSRHAHVVLVGMAAAYLIGFFAIVIARWPSDVSTASPEEWRNLFATASTMSINARTFGLPIEYAASWSRVTQWLVIGLMAVGAASGGTGGGIKVNTIAELIAGVLKILRGQPVTRAFGIALAWLAMYFGIVAATLLLLLHQVTEMAADRVLFLAFSAASNSGLTHDLISITRQGLFTLSAAMFAGRVVPLLVLWWMADTTTDADVAIG